MTRSLVALAALLTATPVTAFAARCPRECRHLLKDEWRTCRAVCPRHRPGHDCRAACVAAFKGDRATCKAATNPTPPNCGETTTTTSTSTSTSTTLGSGCFTDTGDGTIHDTCTRLQWEKKDTTVDSGVDADNLHDVDNRYIWAGRCVYTPIQRCQPSLAAEIACKAQTDAADWWISGCEQCPGGEGNCTTTRQGAITTVWDWVSQLNTAAYAGYSDWRLPSESGCNTCYTDSCTGCLTPSAHELETILLSAYPCGTSPCIDSIFGPTASGFYWSGSPVANSIAAWGVYFNDGYVSYAGPFEDFNDVQCVRAVRGGS